MQLLLLPHLQLSSISPPLLSTAWCSFLPSSAALLRSPLRDAASCHLQLSSPAFLSPALHCVMQLPLLLLSHPQLSSSQLLSSALHCVMQLPLLPHLQLSSPVSLLRCVMQLPVLLSSPPLRDAASYPHLQLSSPPLRDAASSPPSSAALLSSISSAWCSFLSSSHLPTAALPSSIYLLCSPFLLCRSPLFIPPLLSSVFPPPGTGIGYPVPICHPNFIKDWLDIWHLSVGLTSDQYWSEFGDHCSCIWFGEETSYNMS